MSDIQKIIDNLPPEALTPAAAQALGKEQTPEENVITAAPIENNENTPVPPSNVTQESESQSETKEPTTTGGRRTFKRKGGKRKQHRRKTHKKKRRSNKRR